MVREKMEFENVCVLPQENKVDLNQFSFSLKWVSAFEEVVCVLKDFFNSRAMFFCFLFTFLFVLLAVFVNWIYFAAFVPVFSLSLLLLVEKMTFLAVKKDFDEDGIF